MAGLGVQRRVVDVYVSENGTFEAHVVRPPVQRVITGMLSEAPMWLRDQYVIRAVTFRDVKLSSDDMDAVRHISDRCGPHATWNLDGVAFTSKAVAKQLFSSIRCHALCIHKWCAEFSIASRWFFSSSALARCRKLKAPASMFIEASPADEVKAFVGWLHSRGHDAHGQPVLVDLRCATALPHDAAVYHLTINRLLQAFCWSTTQTAYRVAIRQFHPPGQAIRSSELIASNMTTHETLSLTPHSHETERLTTVTIVRSSEAQASDT
ncbi:hypothetical protein AAVH_04761 [Aphelenchoides avenae]|nr:hypothetical protein AAVH_04761 [Aphelenchus avenae]